MKKTVILVGIASFVMLFFSCGKTDSGSPPDIVKSAYMAANIGDYAKANEFLTSKTLKTWKKLGTGVEVNIVEKTWDTLTKNKSIEEISILKEKIVGDSAFVTISINFNDHTTKETTVMLEKENDVWRISMG